MLTHSILDILEVHLEGESLDGDIDLAEIANTTRSYSGSDLKKLATICKKADDDWPDLCVSAAMASIEEAIE